jgi:ribonuclease P protein component
MTAPEGQKDKGERPGPGGSPALFVRDGANRPAPVMITKRRDFIAASKARRWSAPGLTLQGRKRRDAEPCGPDALRVGYTCSKKVGNAVARNRAKRRLRAAAMAVLPQLGRPGWDYVLIGRAEATADRVFADLIGDLEKAIARVHAPKPAQPR